MPLPYFQPTSRRILPRDARDHPQHEFHPFHWQRQKERAFLQMPFALQSNRKLDGSTEVRLIVEASLDRELIDQYRLRLVAHDRGGRSGYIELVVTIADSNDNRPIFDKTHYRTTVSENLPPMTSLLTVKATDLDLGENAKVSYHFSRQSLIQWPLLLETFHLDERTGVLTLVGRLDHEATSMYR